MGFLVLRLVYIDDIQNIILINNCSEDEEDWKANCVKKYVKEEFDAFN